MTNAGDAQAKARLEMSVEALRERYAAGESVPSIAAGMGLTARQVYRWMRHERINRRPPGAPMWGTFPIPLEELRDWYEAGESIVGLARALNVSRHAVKYRLAEAGATLRSRENQDRRRMALPVPSPVLRRRYEASESLYDLAAEMGVAVGTVKLRLLEAGTEMRPVGGRPGANAAILTVPVEELRRRREAGASLASLAAELGVAPQTVRSRITQRPDSSPDRSSDSSSERRS